MNDVSHNMWQIERWETPISDLAAIQMASLSDCGKLQITIEAAQGSERLRWRFDFDTYPGYRNLLEEFRQELWAHLESTMQREGATFTVRNSPWINRLREEEDVFKALYSRVYHYVICTEDDVLEILSPDAPVIQALGPTGGSVEPTE